MLPNYSIYLYDCWDIYTTGTSLAQWFKQPSRLTSTCQFLKLNPDSIIHGRGRMLNILTIGSLQQFHWYDSHLHSRIWRYCSNCLFLWLQWWKPKYGYILFAFHAVRMTAPDIVLSMSTLNVEKKKHINELLKSFAKPYNQWSEIRRPL